jgi:sporulation protein YqfC
LIKNSNLKIDKLKRNISDVAQISEDIFFGYPKAALIGRNKVIISNYKSLIKFYNDYILVNTKIGKLEVLGMGLNIKIIDEESIVLEGEVEKVGFIRE